MRRQRPSERRPRSVSEARRKAVVTRAERALPSGQAAAVRGLLAAEGPTYDQAAATLGVSVNTLKTQLRRARLAQPALWEELARLRQAQLAVRHAAALTRAARHNRQWHRVRFYASHGYWPYNRRPTEQPAVPGAPAAGEAPAPGGGRSGRPAGGRLMDYTWLLREPTVADLAAVFARRFRRAGPPASPQQAPPVPPGNQPPGSASGTGRAHPTW